MVSKSKLCLILTLFVATVSLSCAPNIANYGTPNDNSKFEYVAGNSDKGLVDGSVKEAKFNHPTGMAVDERNGDLYVLDQEDKIIRKISPDGNVSTFITNKDLDPSKSEYGMGSIRIRGNYLYFIFYDSIKRINLDNKLQIETVVGTDEIKDVTGDFEVARFYSINSITLDSEDNIFILDKNKEGGGKIKKANLKTRKVETIQFQNEGSTAYHGGELIISPTDKTIKNWDSQGLDLNPKNNNLYFKISDTFYDEIFQINSINQIMKIGVTGFFNSFTFDNEGNMYLVSIGKFQELRKISLDNTTDVLSGFEGVLKIEKGNQFPEFGNWTDTNLAVDNNRKILYMSTSENKIFKLKLKG